MATRHSDEDGSNIFWPGYVDAVTNLVLNLLFMLTIMIVAVFMFALELGRASIGGPGKTPVVSTSQDAKVYSRAPADPARENVELKLEIQRLNRQLAQLTPLKMQPVRGAETVNVTANLPKSAKGFDKVVADNSEIIVRFKDEAVAFTPQEQAQLRESLQPVVAAGKGSIYVDVPAGFSEARRMGFYRAMAVRNLLLEMKLPKDRINVSVREGKNNTNASIVKVRSE